jgi:carboxypeptidase C (cathepsin A)
MNKHNTTSRKYELGHMMYYRLVSRLHKVVLNNHDAKLNSTN